MENIRWDSPGFAYRQKKLFGGKKYFRLLTRKSCIRVFWKKNPAVREFPSHIPRYTQKGFWWSIFCTRVSWYKSTYDVTPPGLIQGMDIVPGCGGRLLKSIWRSFLFWCYVAHSANHLSRLPDPDVAMQHDGQPKRNVHHFIQRRHLHERALDTNMYARDSPNSLPRWTKPPPWSCANSRGHLLPLKLGSLHKHAVANIK